MELKELVISAQKGKPEAQKMLYDRYAPLLYSICKRYLKDHYEAEDALVESMFKILKKIKTFKFTGSFEGWMRRITVNECLMKLRKNRIHTLSIENAYDVGDDPSIISKLTYEELLEILDQLPTGYRTVFNMYVVEGYKHREIAEELDISINTSKSQLILAKKKFREILKKKELKFNIS